MDLSRFDARTVTPAAPRGAVPAGWYLCQIVESKEKPVKDKPNNSYIELSLAILDGPHKGSRLWDRLNLRNESKEAEEIAWRTLAAIYVAVGVVQVPNMQALHGRPMLVKAKLIPKVMASDGNTVKYPEKNEVDGYMAANGATAPAGAGVGGNTAGVPGWAGSGAAPAPGAAATAPAASTSPAPANAGGWAKPAPGSAAAATEAEAANAAAAAAAGAVPADGAAPNWTAPPTLG